MAKVGCLVPTKQAAVRTRLFWLLLMQQRGLPPSALRQAALKQQRRGAQPHHHSPLSTAVICRMAAVPRRKPRNRCQSPTPRVTALTPWRSRRSMRRPLFRMPWRKPVPYSVIELCPPAVVQRSPAQGKTPRWQAVTGRVRKIRVCLRLSALPLEWRRGTRPLPRPFELQPRWVGLWAVRAEYLETLDDLSSPLRSPVLKLPRERRLRTQ